MTVRRVVVLIATGDHAARVIREAVRVASRFGVELEARFVEDEELLRLAGHSFARAIGTSGAARAFGAADLEREWRAVEADVRVALERAAAQQKLRSRFEVRRARIRDALRVDPGDLVVVGWGGWSPRGRRRAPIRVLYDGSESAERALDAGARLAGEHGVLAVWVVGADDAAVEAMQDRLTDWVGHHRVAPIQEPSVAAVRHILAAQPGGLLIVPTGSAIADALVTTEDARFPAGVLVVH